MINKVQARKQQGCHPDMIMAIKMKILIHTNIILLHQVIESETRLYLLMELVDILQHYKFI